ncbi:MAG: hypothetical protein ACFB0E_00185 [Leptolyngbyaceae cyanobacterium]
MNTLTNAGYYEVPFGFFGVLMVGIALLYKIKDLLLPEIAGMGLMSLFTALAI